MIRFPVFILCLLAAIALAGTDSRASVDDATEAFGEKDFVQAREELLAVFAEAEEGSDEYTDALGLYGWTEFMLDDYLAAQASFRKLEQTRPDDFDALLGMAWTDIKLGNHDRAGTYLDKAEQAAGFRRYLVLDARGWYAIRTNDLDEAEKQFKREETLQEMAFDRKIFPDSKVGLGWVSIFRDEWDDAADEFSDGLQRDSDCFFCRDGLARVALHEGDLDEALDQTVKGLEIVRHNNGLIALLDTILIRANDPERSIAVLDRLIEKYPDDALYYARRGYAQLAAGQTEGADASFRKALELTPGYGLARAGLGKIQFQKTAFVKEGWEKYYRGDYEAALASFEAKRTEARAAGNPSAEDGRGWALLALDRAKEALAAFREALAIDPEFFYSNSGAIAAQRALLVGYNRAWALVNLKRYDEAAAAFERARDEVTDEVAWLIDDGLAWIAYFRGDYDGAAQAFQAILGRNPAAYLSQKGLGFVALAREDWDAAAKNLVGSLVQNPYQILASYITPSIKLLDAKQPLKAKEILELGQRVYPRSADIQFLLAKAYRGLKDIETAEAKAVAAAVLAPAYISPVFEQLGLEGKGVAPAYNSMGWGLYFAGDYAGAIGRFEQYFAAGGNEVSGYLGHGWALLGAGRPKDAEAAFDQALAIKDVADAHAGLGWARLAADNVEEAEANFDKALAISPGNASALRGLGNIQFRKTAFVKEGWEHYYDGDYEAALAAFDSKRAAAKAAGNPAAEDGRGWALLALTRGKEATAAFQAALEIDPDFSYSQSGMIAAKRTSLTLYNQAWARINAGALDEAEALFDRARAEASAEFQWLIDDGLAWISYYRGDYDAADGAFRSILEANPQAYLSRKGRGFVALARGDYDAAINHLTESFVQNPYQLLASYTVPAKQLLDADAYVEAKTVLELGQRAYPRSADIRFLLAKAYFALGNKARAAENAVAAAMLAPAYIHPAFDELDLDPALVKEAYNAMAWGLYFAGDNEGAIARFDQYLAAGGADVNAGRGRAFAQFRLGRYEEAIPGLKQAMTYEPSVLKPITETIPIPGTGRSWPLVYNARSTLAWAYYRLDRPKDAEREFRKVLADNPFWIDALTGLGYARLAQDDRDGARNAFRQALTLSPLYPDARQGLDMAEKG